MYHPHIQVVGERFRSVSDTHGLLGVVLPLQCISVEPHVPDCLYWATHTMQGNTGMCMCVHVCVEGEGEGEGRGTVITPFNQSFQPYKIFVRVTCASIENTEHVRR